MKDKILNLTKQLIMIESISSDIEKLHKIIDFVKNYIKENTTKNYSIEKLIFNKKPSLIIKNFSGKKSDIILNGHLDVVPSSEEKQFNPYERDGKLYGRGSGDMKSGCAIIINLIIEIINSGFKDKKIMLILNTDEELGGFDGAGKITKLDYTGSVVLIPDGGSLNEIVYKEKGVYHLDFEINGKSAHASRPWLGDNAIDKLFRFYNELKISLEKKEIIYDGKKQRWGESISMTMIKGGKADNILPPSARATIDIRFTEKFNIKKMDIFLINLLKKYNGERKDSASGEVLFTSKNNKYLKKYTKISNNNINNIKLVVEHGASDGRYFAEIGSTVILHRPTTRFIHSKGEYVNIKDLDFIYNCYKEFIFSKES